MYRSVIIYYFWLLYILIYKIVVNWMSCDSCEKQWKKWYPRRQWIEGSVIYYTCTFQFQFITTEDILKLNLYMYIQTTFVLVFKLKSVTKKTKIWLEITFIYNTIQFTFNLFCFFQCISIEDILGLHSIPIDKLLTVEDVYSITPDLLYQLSSCRVVEHQRRTQHHKKSPPMGQGSYLSHL